MIYKYKTMKVKRKSRPGLAFIPATPGGKRTWGKRTGKTSLPRTINNEFARRIRMAEDPLGEFQREIDKFTKTAVKADIKGTQYQKIIGPSLSGDDEGEPQALVSHTSRATKPGRGTIGQGRTFKTSIHTGHATSKSVLRNAKDNGSTIETWSDTEKTVLDAGDREHLTRSYGFNQKMIWNVDNLGYWSLADLYNVFGGAGYFTSKQDQVIYADSHHFDTDFRIRNVNTYLRSKVKFHILRQKEKNSATNAEFNSDTFNTTTTAQQLGKIPINRQLLARNDNPLAGGSNNYIDPEGKLNMSLNFQSNFDIVKTYTNVLEAGEEWFINHKHHTGPGLRIDKIIAQVRASTGYNIQSAPFYYYAIEAVGLPCECIKNDNTLIRYTGTAPGALHLEMKKSYKVGTCSTATIYAPEDPGGFLKSDYGFRIYTKPNPSFTIATKQFFVNHSDITDPSNTGATKYSIPVISDMTMQAGGLQK